MRRLDACLAISALAFPGCHHPDLAARKKYRALTPTTPLPASPGQVPGLHAQGDAHDTGRWAPQPHGCCGKWGCAWAAGRRGSAGARRFPWAHFRCLEVGCTARLPLWLGAPTLYAGSTRKTPPRPSLFAQPCLGSPPFSQTEEPPVLVWHLLSCSGSRCFLWV